MLLQRERRGLATRAVLNPRMSAKEGSFHIAVSNRVLCFRLSILKEHHSVPPEQDLEGGE